jgi:hypothetical protein
LYKKEFSETLKVKVEEWVDSVESMK